MKQFNSNICPPNSSPLGIVYPSKIISIQGNLGSGKTTFLKFFSQYLPQLSLMKEPVQEWQNIEGGNLLQNYYKNPKRWSFTFQTYALYSRMKIWKQIQSETPSKLKFSERSMMADRHVFGEIMAQLQNMDELEYTIYKDITNEFLKSWPHSGIIYLRCRPQTCHQRIKKRNRHEQEELPLEYLIKVHEKHQQWIKRENGEQVLIIDTESFDPTNPHQREEIILRVNNFIKKLKLDN